MLLISKLDFHRNFGAYFDKRPEISENRGSSENLETNYRMSHTLDNQTNYGRIHATAVKDYADEN